MSRASHTHFLGEPQCNFKQLETLDCFAENRAWTPCLFLLLRASLTSVWSISSFAAGDMSQLNPDIVERLNRAPVTGPGRWNTLPAVCGLALNALDVLQKSTRG